MKEVHCPQPGDQRPMISAWGTLRARTLLTAANTSLGLFEVTEIALAGLGEPLIEVTFHVDAHGELSVTARDGSLRWTEDDEGEVFRLLKCGRLTVVHADP